MANYFKWTGYLLAPLSLAVLLAALLTSPDSGSPDMKNRGPLETSLLAHLQEEVPRTASLLSSSASSSSSSPTQKYAFGRYTRPIPEPDVEASAPLLGERFGWLRLKRWHYTSLSNERFFVGLAVASLGFAENVWAYVVDKQNPTEIYSYERTFIMGNNIRQFSGSSCTGQTHFLERSNGAEEILIDYSPDHFLLRLNLTTASSSSDNNNNKRRLEGTVKVEYNAQSLGLLFPLDDPVGQQAAYTHKDAAMRVSSSASSLFWGEEELLSSAGKEKEQENEGDEGGEWVATLDWTRSWAKRFTQWRWASLAFVHEDKQSKKRRRIGLNFSALVYGDKENVLWVDGKMYPVDNVLFQLPSSSNKEEWRVASEDGKIELYFQPMVPRMEKMNALLVRNDFEQWCGLYRGRIELPSGEEEKEVIEFENVLGVAEDHAALW
ncbi:hypothetical protein QOT17_022838 [Balamuthia mandrillaris]